jgi:hypothetical protein
MNPLVEVVRLILQRRGIDYDMTSTDEIRVRHGSADVCLSFSAGAGRSVISLSADVLSDCRVDAPEDHHRVLRSLNDRNRSLQFGKFFLDEDRAAIVLRYELLADHLQDEELLNGLVAVAQAADDHDDLLLSEFRTGLRASDRSGREPTEQAF